MFGVCASIFNVFNGVGVVSGTGTRLQSEGFMQQLFSILF